MSTIIMPFQGWQSDRYPQDEWGWRGIVNPAIFNVYNPLINYTWSTTVSSDYITDGVELVTNGGFDSDSDWTLGADWTIENGTLNSTHITSWTSAIQYINDNSKQFYVEFDITEWNSGNLRFEYYNGALIEVAQQLFSNYRLGKYTYYFESTTEVQYIRLRKQDFDGSIDNISVQKVIQKPNTMYLKDSGTTPKYPAELHSGQGVLFGTDKEIVVTRARETVSTELSFCIRATLDSTDNYIFNSAVSNACRVALMKRSNNQVRLSNYNGSKFTSISGGTNLPNGNYVISGTYDLATDSIRLFIDGVEQFETGTSLGVPVSNIYIGSSNGGGYSTAILKDLYIFNDTLTPQEISKYSTNPNGFFQDVQDGVIDNCVLNMPLDGTDEYVRDYANYSELDTLQSFSAIESGDTYDSLVVDSTITSGDINNAQFWFISPDDFVGQEPCYVKFTVSNLVGSPEITSRHEGNAYNGNVTFDSPIPIANGDIVTPIIYGRDSENRVQLYVEASSSWSFDISNIELLELSGIHEIANYTTLARDTTSTLSYGTQELNFTRDGLWRGDLSKYYEMDGTQVPAIKVPMRDTDLGSKWAIEFVISREVIASTSYLLYAVNGNTGIYIRTGASWDYNQITLQVYDGTTYQNTSNTNIDSDHHHIIFENDGSNLTMIVDGVAGTPVAHSFTPSGLKFSDSTQASPKGTLAMFKIWDEDKFTNVYDRDKSVALGAKKVLEAQGA